MINQFFTLTSSGAISSLNLHMKDIEMDIKCYWTTLSMCCDVICLFISWKKLDENTEADNNMIDCITSSAFIILNCSIHT